MSSSSYRPDRTPLVSPGQAELHARDMTATLSGEVTLAEAQRRLAEVGQWLPIDGDPSATLRELVEQNSTGPLRLGYGAWRDLLLGVQFQNGRGELITAGGRVVKNVAGYDLTKFIVGSSGIFGQIITLTTRTWLRPGGVLIARLPRTTKIIGDLVATAMKPQWAMLAGDFLSLGYHGNAAAIEYFRSKINDLKPLEVVERSIEQDDQERAAVWKLTGETAFRAAVPPARLLDFVEQLTSVSWAADAAFGIVLGSNVPQNNFPEIRKLAQSIGGTASFWKRNSTGWKLLDVSTNAPDRQIIERLKAAFDPDGNLHPLPWQIR